MEPKFAGPAAPKVAVQTVLLWLLGFRVSPIHSRAHLKSQVAPEARVWFAEQRTGRQFPSEKLGREAWSPPPLPPRC